MNCGNTWQASVNLPLSQLVLVFSLTLTAFSVEILPQFAWPGRGISEGSVLHLCNKPSFGINVQISPVLKFSLLVL